MCPIDKDEEEKGGQGGKSGDIHFRYRDILSDQPRDDALAALDVKNLVNHHNDVNYSNIQKGRDLRKERKQLKEGKPTYTFGTHHGMGGGGSAYQMHPRLGKEAQFSGARDKNVAGVPALDDGKANENARNELQNRHTHRLQNAPKFNPRPSGPR